MMVKWVDGSWQCSICEGGCVMFLLVDLMYLRYVLQCVHGTWIMHCMAYDHIICCILPTWNPVLRNCYMTRFNRGSEFSLCLVSCVWKEHSMWLCIATHLHQEVLKHLSNMWFILRDRTSCTSMTHFLAIFMPTETPFWSPIWSPCVWLNWKRIHSSTTANRATLPTLVTWLQIATPTPFLVTITPPFFVSTNICLPLSQNA